MNRESRIPGSHFQGRNNTEIQPEISEFLPGHRNHFLTPRRDRCFVTSCLLCPLTCGGGRVVFLPVFLSVMWRVTWCLVCRSLPADVKTAVYAVGAQTSEGWDFLLSKYRLHAFSVERQNIELALSLSGSKDKLQW